MAKNWEKHNRERDLLMKQVPTSLPSGIDQWQKRVCLIGKHHLVYSKDSALCTFCETTMSVSDLKEKPSHKKEGTCPVCGQKTTYLNVNLFKNDTVKYDRYQIRIMQGIKNGIVIRKFRVVRIISKFQGTISINLSTFELQRAFSTQEGMRKNYKHSPYDHSWNESKQYVYNAYGGFYYEPEPEFEYRANVSKIQKRKLPYAKPGMDMDYYMRWVPQIEYLERFGMDKMVNYVIYNGTGLNYRGKTPEKFFRIPKEYLKPVCKLNPDYSQLVNLRKALKYGFRSTSINEVQRVLNSWYLDDRYIGELVTICPEVDVITALKKGMLADYYIYRDYLRMAQESGMDINDKRILYPKDLRNEHDKLVLKAKMKKNAGYKAALKERYDKLHSLYEYSSEYHQVIMPCSPEELIQEGTALHHCVGTYIERIAKGQTLVLFVRERSQPDMPYYTLEYVNGRVVQCRGKDNCSYEEIPSLKNFVSTWEKKVKKSKKQKIAAAIAA